MGILGGGGWVKSMSRKIWTQMADQGQNPLYENALCPGCEDVNLVKNLTASVF